MDLFHKLRQYGLVRFTQYAIHEIKLRLYYRIFLRSYSQYQEDLLIDKILGFKKTGFYVDIGAYDPYRFSNTAHFYDKGWKGINVEPNTTLWQKFIEVRSRDINLNVGVARKKGNLNLYIMDSPTLSTFRESQAIEYEHEGHSISEIKKISVLPLKDIFKKYIKEKTIDFMNIDVESFEMEVLMSNDWKKYKPRLLCIETTKKNLIDKYLNNIGYEKIFDNGLNSFWKRK